MRRLILLLIVLAAAGGGGGYWWLHQRAPSDSTASPAPGARRRFAPPDSIPVLLATAENGAWTNFREELHLDKARQEQIGP